MCGIQDYQEVADQWERHCERAERMCLADAYDSMAAIGHGLLPGLEELLEAMEDVEALEGVYNRVAWLCDYLEGLQR